MNQLMCAVHARIQLGLMQLNSQCVINNRVTMLVGMAIGVLLLIAAPDALASNSMPWEGTICKVAKSLSGTTAKAVALIAVVVSGLMLAFMEVGGIFKMAMGLLCGLSMALLAGQWVGFISGDSSFAC